MKAIIIIKQLFTKFHKNLYNKKFEGLTQIERIIVLMYQKQDNLLQFFSSKKQIQLKQVIDKINKDPFKIIQEIISSENLNQETLNEIKTNNEEYFYEQNNSCNTQNIKQEQCKKEYMKDKKENISQNKEKSYYKHHNENEMEQNYSKNQIENLLIDENVNKDLDVNNVIEENNKQINDIDQLKNKIKNTLSERNEQKESINTKQQNLTKDNHKNKLSQCYNMSSGKKKELQEESLSKTTQNGVCNLNSYQRASQRQLSKVLTGGIQIAKNPTLNYLSINQRKHKFPWACYSIVFEFLISHPSKQSYFEFKQRISDKAKEIRFKQSKLCAEMGRNTQITKEEFNSIFASPTRELMINVLSDEQDDESNKIAKEFYSYLINSKNDQQKLKIDKLYPQFIKELKQTPNHVSNQILNQLNENQENDFENSFKQIILRLKKFYQISNDPLYNSSRIKSLITYAKCLQSLWNCLKQPLEQFDQSKNTANKNLIKSN